MKKLLAFITAIAVFTSGFGMVSHAQDNQTNTESTIENTAVYTEAREVTELVVGKELFAEGAVSRADFVKAVLDFMKIPCTEKHEEYFFSDVKSFSEYAPAVYTAYQKGWISRNDRFSPEQTIAPAEALKILVRAMNYELIAESKGGYPAGDLYVANKLDITEDVDMSAEGLDRNNAYKLLFNAVCAPTLEQISFGDSEEYEKSGESLFESVYDITFVEGIVTRTAYNTLSGNESRDLGDIVEIDGKSYRANTGNWDLLGCMARAFVADTNGGGLDEVVYLTDLSEKITVNLGNFENRASNEITYWKADGTKITREKLSSNCQYIYNGRKISTNIDLYLKKGAGNIVLADNDSDGTYDVVFINSYSYITATGFDTLGKVVGDKYSSEFTLKLADIPYIVVDENGAESDAIDIANGDVLRVEKSLDGGFVKLAKIGSALSGVVSEINTAEGTIVIDDTEYIMSDYFKKLSINKVSLLSEVSLVCDGNVIVSAVADGDDMMYGYFIGAKWQDGMETELLVKIFDQYGKFGEYTVRDKVIIDAVRGNDRDAFYNAVGGGTEHQLVRYGLDGNGELRAIDFATDVLPDVPGVYNDPLNKLTSYTFPSNGRYKSGIASMSAFYNVASSIVFNIPTNINDEEKFVAGTRSLFTHDKSYNLEVYNIDGFGGAEAIVYRNDNPNEVNPDSNPLLIRSINHSLDSNGDHIYTINGWSAGSFVTMYLEDDIEVKKNSTLSSARPVKSVHPLLSGGDIVSFAADSEGYIKTLSVIFDARENVFAMNDTRVNQPDHHSPQYYEGKIFDVGNNFAALGIAGYDFSQANLRYASLNTGNIVMYNAKNGDTRPLSVNEIKTYKTNGNDAHYAVFCMNNFTTKTVVLFEETEAR